MQYRNTNMKVMWLCNTPTAAVAKACKIPKSAQGGWLVSVANELEQNKGVEFTYVLLSKEAVQGIQYVTNERSTYVTVNMSDGSDSALIAAFEEVLKKQKPEIIHIWGTEYKHSWAMVEAAKKVEMIDQVVISIQGMASMYAMHYMGGIPGKYQMLPSFRDWLRKDSLKIQKRNMYLRGKYEISAIKDVKHAIGRTFWDHACVKLLNPQINYHFNNETLRENFYTSEWQYSKCRKHSIFVSQSHYPIKGFHYLVEAVAILKEKYPDVQVYVSGHGNAFKTGVLETAYGKYIKHLMRKYHLTENIQYVGMLDAEQMKQQFLKSEVFVSPSVIENSPNSVGEAMLLGMPIVSSNVGGVSDMLTHGKDGWLYQSDAPYLLAYYVSQFFENQSMEYEFGENAKAHARKTHNKEENIKKLLEIYEELLQGKVTNNDKESEKKVKAK